MAREILLHIDEDLTEAEQSNLMRSFGNRPGVLEPHLHSARSHMMFVAYDPEELCPHDLVDIAEETGIHAQVVDL